MTCARDRRDEVAPYCDRRGESQRFLSVQLWTRGRPRIQRKLCCPRAWALAQGSSTRREINLPLRPHCPPTYSRGVTSMVLLDPNKEAEKSYQIAYTPTVFLVDRHGKLVGKAIGERQWTGEQGKALLRRLLARRS
jgi:hypothetical protein